MKKLSKKLFSPTCLCGIALFVTTVFYGCENLDVTETNDETELNVSLRRGNGNSENLIDFVKRQINPFTVTNMRMALDSIAGTKRVAIPASFKLQPTHYFVRFLPKSEDELKILERKVDAGLIDNSINIEMISEGRYCLTQAQTKSNKKISWQYTAVPFDFNFPEIEYEILESLFIDDGTNGIKDKPIIHSIYYDDLLRGTGGPNGGFLYLEHFEDGFNGEGSGGGGNSDNGDLIVMTYNLGSRAHYTELAEVIKNSNADVVAVQEVRGSDQFISLKNKTGMNGNMCITIPGLFFWDYGIALLWKSSMYNPLSMDEVLMLSAFSGNDTDPFRAYIVAEFYKICIVSTHYSLHCFDQWDMTSSILNHNLVTKCKNSGKPIYIAGDLNPTEEDGRYSLYKFQLNGFEILNDMTMKADPPGSNNYVYEHATRPGGGMPDFILEYNKNPDKELIYRGIPPGASYTISDHLPYRVKVKYK